MLLSQHCGSESAVKNSFVCGKQRYKCKNCGKTFRVGDNRKKYDISVKMRVMKYYLRGTGIRTIEANEGISSPLILQWIRKFSSIVTQNLNESKIDEDCSNIEILEIDELFTFYKKNKTKPISGLLWTESGIKLLTLR